MNRKVMQGLVQRCGKAGLFAASLGIALALGAAGNAHADTLFATSFGNSLLAKVDTDTMSVSTVENTPVSPDSLVFDPSGNIIYTGVNAGQVRLFNPNTNTDTLINGSFFQPRDLTLEPGGHTILVSDFNAGALDRLDLTSGLITLSAPITQPNGVTYDNSGRLFVVSGNVVDQLDPTTLGIINSSAPFTDSLDGMTFDPVTGKLFASDEFGNQILELDPSNLSSSSVLTNAIPTPDGIESDGKGNLFAASFSDSHIYQDVLATNTVTQNALVPGLDDLAPVAGLGAPPPPTTPVVPEPGSLCLLFTGGLPLLGLLRRRRA